MTRVFGAACLIVLASGMPGCSTMEHRCLYRPTLWDERCSLPQHLTVETAHFEAEDGTRLHGWFVPCEGSRNIILFAHGQSGNITDLAEPLADFCQRHHASIMVFDYRGYGKSEGVPSEHGLYQDARAARKWLARRCSVAESEVILMGRSLGGAVMIHLAAEDGAKGLIVESSFCSLPALARRATGCACLFRHNRFASLEKIARYQGPILISHGESDWLIPISHAKRLFDAANEPRYFVVIPDAGHLDPPGDEYHEHLAGFLNQLESASEHPRSTTIRYDPIPGRND